ncbi:hypothetical protein BY458DRAFT_506061 [Sporodiniella umbellata]|nr:hypothetical protein BY458DRAFT_506061 [Sporodiniella umbellata]
MKNGQEKKQPIEEEWLDIIFTAHGLETRPCQPKELEEPRWGYEHDQKRVDYVQRLISKTFFNPKHTQTSKQ